MPRGIPKNGKRATRRRTIKLPTIALSRWIRMEFQYIAKKRGKSLESVVQDALCAEIERFWKDKKSV